MGSPISPPLAMLFLEHFEKHIYESKMPNHLKATEWARYVDDIFVVYEHSDKEFDEFFRLLNSYDPNIKFTCERAQPGWERGYGPEVVETLPFLDVLVIRYLDRQSNTLSNKLSIYRKPSHSGSYMHSLSEQPLSTKRSVIRSLFLRAYRYCDTLFLENELEKVYTDFGRLGYNRKFIDKARISAKQGRSNEIKVRAGTVAPKPPRPRQPFHLIVPYNKYTKGLKHDYVERGIEVIYTSRDSLGSRVTWRKRTAPMESGVYIYKCADSSCDKVYVGETNHYPRRFDEHRRAIRGSDSVQVQKHATARHIHHSSGLKLDPDSPVIVYRSSSRLHRQTIEGTMITLFNTVAHTKANSNVKDMDIIGPIILGASPIDWRLVAIAQPNLDRRVVPKAYRRFFH